MKFEEIWPRGFRGDVNGRTDRGTDGRMTDDGLGVITIAHIYRSDVEELINMNAMMSF